MRISALLPLFDTFFLSVTFYLCLVVVVFGDDITPDYDDVGREETIPSTYQGITVEENLEGSIPTTVSANTSDGSSHEEATEHATTTKPVRCSEKPFEIKRICTLEEKHIEGFGMSVTVEDLTNLIYHQDIIERLIAECPPGEWCLSKDWDLRYDNLRFLQFCDLNVCLLNITDNCLTRVGIGNNSFLKKLLTNVFFKNVCPLMLYVL